MIKTRIKQNIELKELTTLKIGGPARYFVSAETVGDVIEAVAFAEENELKIFVLGGGSNVLISDEGFDGLVLQLGLKGIENEEETAEGVKITVWAGEDWDDFVGYCVGRNLAGIECLSGIPGLVGGAPIQNIGAYGQEVSETIIAVNVFDRKTKEILVINNSECKFKYRTSIFNSTENDRFIVLSVTFGLRKNGAPKIVYKDLIDYFRGRVPTLAETRDAVRRIRSEKAMLVRQGGPDSYSAGSFFKNPLVSKRKYEEITAAAKKMGIESVPNFEVDAGTIKIPAAWLIERAGFPKGFSKGNAGLSTRHALALTNRGNATAADILELKKEIEKKVRDLFGVELHHEPVFIGFNNRKN